MKLHKDMKTFEELAQVVSEWKNIPYEAIKRDYVIVLVLQKLAESDFVNKCIFKGGTSLSKCYPDVIKRVSEDVDLTFIETELSDNQKDKFIKKLEETLWTNLNFVKIDGERSKVSKSSYVWIDEIGEDNKIKLEIGSKIRPEPSKEMMLKTYIQEYLEANNLIEIIVEYELTEVTVLVLDITRTFLDKVLAVKRHAYNDDLVRKVRHIYDVVKLFETSEVRGFLQNKEELGALLSITKQTDSFYLNKRKDYNREYNPESDFEFDNWKEKFDKDEVKVAYEALHKELLYTHVKQDFNIAIRVFEEINEILEDVEK